MVILLHILQKYYNATIYHAMILSPLQSYNIILDEIFREESKTVGI
jgi:hypothetical protein